MKLKAVFEIHGLSNVLEGKRKAEGIAQPGDLYEVDDATAKVHQKEGYGIDPNDPDLKTDERPGGPQIIEGELDNDDEKPSLNDIAPPAAKPAAKKSGGKKKAAAQVEETPAAPAEDATSEDDLDDLGLDDNSDSVE